MKTTKPHIREMWGFRCSRVGLGEEWIRAVEENEEGDLGITPLGDADGVDAAQEELEEVREDLGVSRFRALGVSDAKRGEEQVLDDRHEVPRIAVAAEERITLFPRNRVDDAIESVTDEALAHLLAQTSPDFPAHTLARADGDVANDIVQWLDQIEPDMKRAVRADVVCPIELQALGRLVREYAIGGRGLGERGLPRGEALADGEEAGHRTYPFFECAFFIYIKMFLLSTLAKNQKEPLAELFFVTWFVTRWSR